MGTSKSILVISVLFILLIGAIALFSYHKAKKQQLMVATQPVVSVTPTAMPAAPAADSQLNSDIQNVDSSLNSINTDLNSVDNSLNDQPDTLQ